MDYTVHGISRPEYWSGQPFPSPGGLPNPRIELRSPALKADSLPAKPPGKPVPSPADLPYPGIKPGSPALQADCLPIREEIFKEISLNLFTL